MTTEQQTTIERGVADSQGRVPSAEERVSYIEGALPELARRSDVAGVRIEMSDFKTEIKSDIADIKADVAVLNLRMDRVEQDVKELKVPVDRLEVRMVETETRLVRWMIGIGAPIVGAMAVLQTFFN